MAGLGIISLVSDSDPIRRSSSLQPRGPTSGAASRNRHDLVNVTLSSQRRRHRNGLVTPRTAAAQMAHLGSRSAIRTGARFPLTPQGAPAESLRDKACPCERRPRLGHGGAVSRLGWMALPLSPTGTTGAGRIWTKPLGTPSLVVRWAAAIHTDDGTVELQLDAGAFTTDKQQSGPTVLGSSPGGVLPNLSKRGWPVSERMGDGVTKAVSAQR